MEREQAIIMLHIKMQALFRILATKKLKQFSASDNHHNVMAKRQTYILRNINSKLEKENAMVAKADKGKACVIIYTDKYNKKSTTSLMRTTFKNLKKFHYNMATLL